ncbi:reverse transcriptase domain-containing protein [Tanacetum coccineum]|uniref:Reverse transcriptase domain-containing protein n=1 Tax=Tanacetum coccineum TaxID=301880 RepID=A0ABQ4ZWK7_9ASTR
MTHHGRRKTGIERKGVSMAKGRDDQKGSVPRVGYEYSQIRMTEDDEENTGFHTEEGIYCFTHMPKELKNSAAKLHRMMEKVLADQRGQNVEIYLEEIVIKSKSELDLVQDVEETLRKLKRVNIKIDPETLDANEGGKLNLNKKLQAKSTPTPRAWRLYLGKETIEEGSGVGIILASLEKRMPSYVIRLKFNTFDHIIDCEALLAGLAASVSKGMKDLHVFMDSPKLVAQTEGNHTPATEQERKYKKEIMDVTAPFYRKYRWVSKQDHRWKRQAAARREKQQAMYQVQSQTTIGKLVGATE